VNVLQLDKVSAAPWGTVLLDDISLSLNAGEVLGIIGPNGAGKSTLLKAIAGDIALQRGDLLVQGRPHAAWPRRKLARTMAFLPQLSLLNFPYTVEEVVMLGRTPHDTGTVIDREVMEDVLAVTDIEYLRSRLYTQLSGGEKQRVQLARIFAQVWNQDSLAGTLLLLDEPTTALDLTHQQQIASVIRELANRGCAAVLVIHDFNIISGMADQLIALQQGRLVAAGTPRQVMTEALFRDVFQVEVIVSDHPHRDQPVIIGR
jgi:iron complex transport system ATP-binding protein